ncbi:MAG: glycoside hydrolase family 97 protein [Ignavibacteriaceae bacterium]
MRRIFFLLFMISHILSAQTIKSPDGRLSLTFSLTGIGEPTYTLFFNNSIVVSTSKLGINLKDQPNLAEGFTVLDTKIKLEDETWEPVWGEVKTIRNNCNELEVTLRQTDNRKLVLRFRLFNDGLGFRYEFPLQDNLKYFTVADELTEFNLTGDHKTFWIPGDYDTNEYFYTTSNLSEVDATYGVTINEISTKSVIGKNFVQTPLMMKSKDNLYINIHEAGLINYPAMNLGINQTTFSLKATLVPDVLGNKAYLQTPCHTPYRTILVSDKATDILASKTILNLNDPSVIANTDWIKPIKYIGIWWELHVGKSYWNYADVNNVKLDLTDWKSLTPTGKHGATTQRTKYYIDFAAEHGFDAVLVEGWNIGWEDWFGQWKEDVFDFVTPYPDFDVAELQKYAENKKVKLIMHHETSASATNYERRMDEAYRFMKKFGYDAVKTGYVGRIIPRGEHHDGQWMVNHYLHTAKKTAEYQIMLNAHEPVRPTGLHRTYPNWLACEAARGNEFNAWSRGNPPEHETILPFTRLMGGPMDYTPGIFEIKMSYYDPSKKEQVHTTLAKQLALYVTMYSPLQMAADLPENYLKYPDAFQFIKDVSVDWDDTKILEAEPGDYITIVRKSKGKDKWFLGAITDENRRTAEIKCDFLEKDRWYTATIYADGKNAHWEKNPISYEINKYLVNSKSAIKLILAESGGTAISFIPATGNEIKNLKKY